MWKGGDLGSIVLICFYEKLKFLLHRSGLKHFFQNRNEAMRDFSAYQNILHLHSLVKD